MSENNISHLQLQKKIQLPDEVRQAGQDGKLVFFVGAGISRLHRLPSWRGLAERVLEDLREKGCINYSDMEQLNAFLSPRQILSIAKSISKTKEVELEIEKHFDNPSEAEGIYNIINSIGCVCVTTNYDTLLVPQASPPTDETQRRERAERVYARERIDRSCLDRPGTIIHLHGCKEEPNSMVITTKDYLEHYSQENIQEFLKGLFADKTVVFLGYGLDEMEILESIFRHGEADKSEAHKSQEVKHFIIEGFFLSQQPIYENLHKYYDETFGVKLLGYIRDDEDYSAIKGTLEEWAGQITIRSPLKAELMKRIRKVLEDE